MDPHPENDKRARKAFLDGWRGYAIFFIMMGHILGRLNIDFSGGLNKFAYTYFINLSVLPVSVFLLIAGMNMSRLFVSVSSGARGCIAKRFVRILPLLFVVSLASMFVFEFALPPYAISVKQRLPAHTSPYGFTVQGDLNNGYRVLDNYTGETLTAAFEKQNGKLVIDGNGVVMVAYRDRDGKPEPVRMVFEGAPGGIRPGIQLKPYMEQYAMGEWPFRNPSARYIAQFLWGNYFTDPEQGVPYLAHIWFVVGLLHCTIFICAVLAVMGRVGVPRKPMVAIAVAAGILAALAAVRMLITHEYRYNHTSHYIMEPLLLGVVMGVFVNNVMPLFSEKARAATCAVMFAAGAAALMYLLRGAPFIPERPPVALSFAYVPLGLILAAACCRNVIVRYALENPMVTTAGKYSLGIYLFHQPYMYIFIFIRNYTQSMPVMVALFVATSVVGGVIAEKAVDWLVNKTLKRSAMIT